MLQTPTNICKRGNNFSTLARTPEERAPQIVITRAREWTEKKKKKKKKRNQTNELRFFKRVNSRVTRHHACLNTDRNGLIPFWSSLLCWIVLPMRFSVAQKEMSSITGRFTRLSRNCLLAVCSRKKEEEEEKEKREKQAWQTNRRIRVRRKPIW